MRIKIWFSIACLFFLGSLMDAFGQSSDQARLVVKTGHANKVSSVAFSPDGKTLASGSWDNIVKLWEVASGQELRALPGHSNYVTSVAFSPDGKILASGSWDNTVKLWEVSSGQELHNLPGHADKVTAVAFSPDGKTVASASDDRTIKVWNATTGQEVRSFTGHLDKVNSIAFSPDGNTLTSAGEDKTVRLWNVATGEQSHLLTHSDYVKTVAFSPDGKTLASGSYDKLIRLWDAASGQELGMLVGHISPLTALAFSPDSKTLASSGWEKTVRLWNVTNREQSGKLEQSNFVNAVAFRPNSQMLATAGWDKAIKLWQVPGGKDLQTLAGHSSYVSSVVFSPDGKMLASGGWDKAIKLWDLAGNPQLLTLTGHKSYVNCVAFSSDGRTLASGSWDKTIKLWDLASLKELRTLTGHSRAVRSVAFSHDGKTVASGSDDKTIKLWDVSSGKEVRTLAKHSDIVRSVVFSPDGTMLASGSWDKTVRLWNVATGEELRRLEDHSDKVTAVAFSADGKTLASGGWDKKIKLWEVASGKVRRTLEGHSAGIYSIAFSDSKTLASGSDDKTIKLWDLVGGEAPKTLGGQWVIYSVAFSPNGNTLATAGAGARIRLWRTPGGGLSGPSEEPGRAGNEMSSLIALDQKDWAIVTPDGWFDASPAARKLMHYMLSGEVVTLDQMKDLYYLPGLLPKLMAGDPLPKVELFTKQDLFPEAEHQQLKPDQKTLTVKLRNRGGGIGPVQVFVNGTEVIADARPTGFDPQSKQVELTIDLSNVKQLSPGRENIVEVIARNTTGSLSSKGSARGVKIAFVGAGTASTELPDLYAIIGGVSRYVDDGMNLRYSGKDAIDFTRALSIGAAKLLKQEKVHIRLLTSEKIELKELVSAPDASLSLPTKENFRKVFSEVADKAKPDDILVVFLSGHGVAFRQQSGELYLYLTQEAYTTDSSNLAEEKVRTATSISSDELIQWIREIRSSKKALVLDTCAAGAAAESLIARKDVPTDQLLALERLKDRSGFFVLMGSAADKVSYETTTFRQGLLTYSVLEALKGARLDGEYANVGPLFDYAQERVPQLARGIGAIQQPRSLRPDVGSPFPIGRFTADEQKLFTLPSPSPLILRPNLLNQELGRDNLKLLPAFQSALRAASFGGTSNKDPSLVFVEADEMHGAFQPVGLYTVAGDKVTIKLNLMRYGNDDPVATQMVEGTVTDEQSKAALIQKLITVIITESQKYIDSMPGGR